MTSEEQLNVWAGAHPKRRVDFDESRPGYAKASATLETGQVISRIGGTRDRVAGGLIRMIKTLGAA